MSVMLTVEEAARRLGVSQYTLADVIRSGKAPLPFRRVGRQYLIPPEGLKGVLEGQQASPLVRDALARARRQDDEAGASLAQTARSDTARLWGAIREAHAGSRLARAARSPERRTWERAHHLLLEMWRRRGLPSPMSSRFYALTSRLEGGTSRRKGKRQVRPPRGWVSKTDMIRYVRCPYSFWLLDRGEITFEDTIDEFQLRLLREGNEFQGLVESAASRIEVEPAEVPALLGQEVMVLGVPVFENPQLKIRGQPDGVDAAGGALYPVEIKSHREVQRTDELELAFYWLLLEPYRTVTVPEPRGYLILRRDGVAEWVEVRIRPHRFEEVRRLIQAVRDARHRGVRPRICGCIVCSQLRREDVLRATQSRRDLTLIFGIGRAYAPALEALGVADWDALLRCEPQPIVEGLRKLGYFVSTAEVERWKRHAESWSRGAVVYFGDVPCLESDSFVALDLEYGYDGFIWLIGAGVVDRDHREYVSLWADNPSEEERNLGEFVALLAAHQNLPLVTWAGEGADIPRLREAAARLEIGELTEAVQASHRDLYQCATRSFRLPISSLSLKAVAEYYGIPRISTVRSGLHAQMMYGEYRRTQDEERRATLRGQLIDYNRDDVESLIGVTEQMRAVALSEGRLPGSTSS